VKNFPLAFSAFYGISSEMFKEHSAKRNIYNDLMIYMKKKIRKKGLMRYFRYSKR